MLTKGQTSSLNSILTSFKSNMVVCHQAYLASENTLTLDELGDLQRQGFSLGFVLSKYMEKEPELVLEDYVAEAERLRDTHLYQFKEQKRLRFQVKPVLTKERFCEFSQYESNLKQFSRSTPQPNPSSLITANSTKRFSQEIESSPQYQQLKANSECANSQSRDNNSQLRNYGQHLDSNRTTNPSHFRDRRMPRYQSVLGPSQNAGGYNNENMNQSERQQSTGFGNRSQDNNQPWQKNESYQGYGRNNNNNSAQSEGQGFYRNKFMNRNNSSQGNMGDDDTNSQTAGTFVTASEQAQQNAQLKRQRQEGFFNKESGRYGRNSGNIELEGVGASRQGNQNQNKYGGGGVDSVVNMVHYHTLGRNINMNNSVPQQEVQQQASLCDGGYEDESKPKGQISKKFKPPGAPGSSQSTNQRNGNAQANEQLKGMDQKLVDLIESEIVENGTVIHWDDIAGLNSAKEAVHESIVWPMLNPKLFKGIRAPPKGLLLFGPPGTGKTMIGKAIACESKSTFFSISASSLTSKYIGEGEKMVKILFKLALVRQPSVIFIDEIDSLLCSRTENENEASRRIKTEFMVQMEGANTKTEERILMIGATNRPQELDDAVLRRFPKKLYIPLPNMVARKQLIKRVISNEEMEGTIFNLEEYDMDAIVNATKGYSGADMKNLCSEASLIPIRLCRGTNISNMSSTDIRPINKDDFLAAIRLVKATVSEKDLTGYLDWNSKFGSFEISETDINN